MKVTVERAELLKSLSHMHRVVERRNTIPILANVLVRAEKSALNLKATDLDVEVVEKIAAEVPWLKYVPTISRPWDNVDWHGERGRADDLIRKYIEVWNLAPADTTAYLCGHPGMVETGRGMLLRAGWAKTSIQDEVYFQPGT